MLDTTIWLIYIISMDNLRKEFRQYLNEKDMRLTQAAKLLQCSVGAISKFLLGKTRPNERTAYKIRKLIGK